MSEIREETELKHVAPETPKEITVPKRKRKADVATCLHDPDEEEETMTTWCESEVEGSSQCVLDSKISKPDQEEYQPALLANDGFPHYNFNDILATPVRRAPLPVMCWASKDEMWNNMLEKDKIYSKDANMMKKHPRLLPKMRAILFDWLMEVSQAFRLRKETYHLAQDYFDRFMGRQCNICKSALQLIGITCLFIAIKMEEMCPPKVCHLVYVTDDACTEEELLSTEIIILDDLNWNLNPQTPIAWLNVYMQLAYLNKSEELLTPQFPQATFSRIAELLDLCMLDVHCLEFSNGILAASALFHFSSLELVENVSALNRVEVEECVRWMEPFAMALKEAGLKPVKANPGVSPEEVHNFQTHSSYLPLLEKVLSCKEMASEDQGTSSDLSGILTPPLSNEKSDESLPLDAVPVMPPKMYSPSWEEQMEHGADGL